MRKWLTILIQLRSPADFLLFLRVSVFVLFVPALFRINLSKLQFLLEPRKPLSTFDPVIADKIAHFVDELLTIASPIVHRVCLTRGTTLYYFLRRAGLDVSLCFGIGKVEGRVMGHCWLVKDTEPFMEKSDPRPLFTPIFWIPRHVTPSGNLRSLLRVQ